MTEIPDELELIPVRIKWVTQYGAWKTWFEKHHFVIGETSDRKPTWISGWTYHIGPIKIVFGMTRPARFAVSKTPYRGSLRELRDALDNLKNAMTKHSP